MSKIALVVGGAGTIGSGTVKAFIKDGSCAKVVATSRDQARLDKLIGDVKSDMGDEAAAKIVGVVGGSGSQAGAEALKAKVVEAVGEKIDYVVAVMGLPFYQGAPLCSTTRDAVEEVMNTIFFPQFEAWKVFMPLIKSSGGTYVIVTGGGPDMFLGPGTTVMTIVGSTATGFAKSAMKETAGEGFTSTEVSFNAGVAADPSVMPPGYTWLSSKEAGSALVSVALKRKAHVKTVVIKDQNTMDQVIADGVV